jgi:hypothetical protein
MPAKPKYDIEVKISAWELRTLIVRYAELIGQAMWSSDEQVAIKFVRDVIRMSELAALLRAPDAKD